MSGGDQSRADGRGAATSGNGSRTTPELLVTLDRAGGGPLRFQLERELRQAVRSGRLHAGTALPSTRALARELGVSRGVVVEAYAQLAAEGYLNARQGAATTIAPIATQHARGRAGTRATAPLPRYDLRPSVPDLSAFPRRAWLASERRALMDAPYAGFDYPDRRGVPALRSALAAYLGRARGVVADADRVVITTGTFQSVALLARVLKRRGVERVAVELPGFTIHVKLLRRTGLTTVPVPVDDDGLVTDALADSGAEAVLVTPAHQVALGGVLPAERRAALLDWAARTGALVIEDDYDSEFRYDREPVGALQGLAPERVAYLGSASKVLAPAVRLGWAVLPAWLAGDVTDEKEWDDHGSPAFGQAALADFVERGELDRHLRRIRPGYRRRRDALLRETEALFPGARVRGVAAGLHATVQPRRQVDERELIARARERGVAMYAFRDPASGASTLMLGYSNVPEPSIAPALRELAAAYEASSA